MPAVNDLAIPELALILARTRNGVIGRDGVMPWHLPEDLAHFRQLTQGCAVVMGRKTWDSLPPRFRPLPGRRNLVLTRQQGWQAPGAEVYHSLDAALAAASGGSTVWVIGGAELYEQALPRASRVELTEIDTELEGDAFAPTFGPEWQSQAAECQTSVTGLPYRFVTLSRPRGAF